MAAMYCILTENPRDWNNARLGEALEGKGKEFIFLRITDLVAFNADKPHIRNLAYELDSFEKVFVRGIPGGSLEQIIFRMDVLHRLENLGVECINSASSIEKCTDKYYASSLLEDAGLRVPKTVCCETYEDAFTAFLKMKDVVVKPLFGSQGMGIVRINDEDSAYRIFRSLELHRYVFYIQEYLEHNNEDIRILVCRDEIISSMKRKSDSWKTNISRGARVEEVTPDEEMREMAFKASKTLGCHYCGVDILVSDDGTFVLEVNAIPAWHGLQSVTDFDIASRIVELLG
jgi:ribosomal protein S6--L-glutamate ligase/tetrahydromethanopterin:alpha-L-glutamate ligase